MCLYFFYNFFCGKEMIINKLEYWSCIIFLVKFVLCNWKECLFVCGFVNVF